MIFINMKFIITESKLERTAINWLNKEYGDLIPVESDEHPNHIFYMKDKKLIFYYDKKNGEVYVSYKHIWPFFEDFFGMEYQQIQDITKKWVEEHYKLEVTTTSYIS